MSEGRQATNTTVGKLLRVPLRDVWRHEALDFTKWLEDNPDVLSEALGIRLASIERERNAGSFNVDLVAEDESGNSIIVENQLEKSDHDHLGKILTYLAAIEAKAAVWIVADPRPEHVKAVAWLNDSSSGGFYLLKVEAVRIGDSPPAPLLTRIVGPSEQSKIIGGVQKERAARHVLRRRFWTELIEYLRQKRISLHANLSPTEDPWLSTGAGRSGLAFVYRIRMTDATVEFHMDLGRDAEKATLRMYEHFASHKDEIEAAYGGPLEWFRVEGTRHCKIIGHVDVGGLKEQEKWQPIRTALAEAMLRLEKAVSPLINALPS